MVRGFALTVGLLAAVPAAAGESVRRRSPPLRHRKDISYTCFEGTRGQGPRECRWLGDRLHPIPGFRRGTPRAPAGQYAASQRSVGLRLAAWPAHASPVSISSAQARVASRIDIGAGLCLLRFHAPRPNDRRAQRAAYADCAAARLCAPRSLPTTTTELQPFVGKIMHVVVKRAHKACPRGP